MQTPAKQTTAKGSAGTTRRSRPAGDTRPPAPTADPTPAGPPTKESTVSSARPATSSGRPADASEPAATTTEPTAATTKPTAATTEPTAAGAGAAVAKRPQKAPAKKAAPGRKAAPRKKASAATEVTPAASAASAAAAQALPEAGDAVEQRDTALPAGGTTVQPAPAQTPRASEAQPRAAADTGTTTEAGRVTGTAPIPDLPDADAGVTEAGTAGVTEAGTPGKSGAKAVELRPAQAAAPFVTTPPKAAARKRPTGSPVQAPAQQPRTEKLTSEPPETAAPATPPAEPEPTAQAVSGDVTADRSADAATPSGGSSGTTDQVATPEPAGRWAAAAADPRHAVELLALAAVDKIGPRAQTWAREMREAYPSADADGLARLAVRRCLRMAGVGGAAAATAGVLAPFAGVATQSWANAELVLHVAAAYGLDPTDRARAADLLVLTRVYPGHREATAGLAGATGTDASTNAQPAAEGAWRLAAPMAIHVGSWVVARLVARGVPGVALLVAAFGSRAAADRLAARAVAHYRGQAGR